MTGAFLSCDGVRFSRSGRGTVLDNVTLAFPSDQMVGVLGLNGAGKTTLFRTLLGFLKPQAGRVWLDGKALPEWSAAQVARRIAYVPQAHAAAFPYTVRRMVELGRVPHRGIVHALTRTDHEAVEAALARLGLQDMADRPVTQLSGGERQRVVLARALAQEARALLLDEPMTGLDYGHQLRLMALLRGLASDGRLVLMTSHRPEDLLGVVDRVLVMTGGRVVADGPPADIVTAERMSDLYGVALTQFDRDGSRFFTLRGH